MRELVPSGGDPVPLIRMACARREVAMKDSFTLTVMPCRILWEGILDESVDLFSFEFAGLAFSHAVPLGKHLGGSVGVPANLVPPIGDVPQANPSSPWSSGPLQPWRKS